MQKYAVFLRGVNVNGRKVKMDELKSHVSKIGVKDVSTLLASGNLVFTSKQDADELESELEQTLSAYYDFRVKLFVKNEEEIVSMIRSMPFKRSASLHDYIFLCDPGFEKALFDAFKSVDAKKEERGELNGGYFYWQVKKGETLSAGFSKILGKKDFADKFTSRNRSTIEKVRERMKTIELK